MCIVCVFISVIIIIIFNMDPNDQAKKTQDKLGKIKDFVESNFPNSNQVKNLSPTGFLRKTKVKPALTQRVLQQLPHRQQTEQRGVNQMQDRSNQNLHPHVESHVQSNVQNPHEHPVQTNSSTPMSEQPNGVSMPTHSSEYNNPSNSTNNNSNTIPTSNLANMSSQLPKGNFIYQNPNPNQQFHSNDTRSTSSNVINSDINNVRVNSLLNNNNNSIQTSNFHQTSKNSYQVNNSLIQNNIPQMNKSTFSNANNSIIHNNQINNKSSLANNNSEISRVRQNLNNQNVNQLNSMNEVNSGSSKTKDMLKQHKENMLRQSEHRKKTSNNNKIISSTHIESNDMHDINVLTHQQCRDTSVQNNNLHDVSFGFNNPHRDEGEQPRVNLQPENKRLNQSTITTKSLIRSKSNHELKPKSLDDTLNLSAISSRLNKSRLDKNQDGMIENQPLNDQNEIVGTSDQLITRINNNNLHYNIEKTNVNNSRAKEENSIISDIECLTRPNPTNLSDISKIKVKTELLESSVNSKPDKSTKIPGLNLNTSKVSQSSRVQQNIRNEEQAQKLRNKMNINNKTDSNPIQNSTSNMRNSQEPQDGQSNINMSRIPSNLPKLTGGLQSTKQLTQNKFALSTGESRDDGCISTSNSVLLSRNPQTQLLMREHSMGMVDFTQKSKLLQKNPDVEHEVVKVKKEEDKIRINGDNCGICTEPLNVKNSTGNTSLTNMSQGQVVILLKCTHCFHELCLRSHMARTLPVSKRRYCPICEEIIRAM